MKVEFVASAGSAEILALFVKEGGEAPKGLAAAVKASRFKGGRNSALTVPAPSDVEAGLVVLTGLGDGGDLDLEAAAGAAYRAVATSGLEILTFDASGMSAEQAARIGFAARLAAYRFDKYRTTEKAEKIPSVRTVRVVTGDVKACTDSASDFITRVLSKSDVSPASPVFV